MGAEGNICVVCYRPSTDAVCSRRCQGLAKVKRTLDDAAARRLILSEVQKLKKDESVNPGLLAQRVLQQMGISLNEDRDALSLLRETFFSLRQEGAIRFFQKNRLIPKGKGPLDFEGGFDVKGK